MSAPSISIEAMSKRYGTIAALDGVEVHIDSGRCLALVGESGSGKTTLLHSVNRLVSPDRGTVRIDGRPVDDWSPEALRRTIGYVPQHGGLLPHWTVERNVALVPRLLGYSDATRRARAALGAVGLDPGEFSQRWPRSMSGGQRQRVALARALAADPGLVLLDEPFGALDALSRADIQRLFLDLREARPFTAVLVTHDLREAFHLADDIAVMRDGRIERHGSVADVRARPDSPYVEALFERAGVAP